MISGIGLTQRCAVVRARFVSRPKKNHVQSGKIFTVPNQLEVENGWIVIKISLETGRAIQGIVDLRRHDKRTLLHATGFSLKYDVMRRT